MSIITDTLNQVVDSVEVRTAYGPTISLNQPFAPSPPGNDSGATKFLQPVFTIYPKAGLGEPIVYAPYGDPGESKWPFIVTGLGLLIGWLAYRAFGR